MIIWPQSPPQISRIPDRSSELENDQINDSGILKTISLIQSNLLVMLTPARVLVYNCKPLALVASHERSKDSIDEFGENVTIKASIQFTEAVDGLVSTDELNALNWFQGKIVFYVLTTRNYLLTYQVLKNSSPYNIFTEYGINAINPDNLNGKIDQDYDFNIDDDDTLTVFEKNKSSKVIQNGYITSKDKSILKQILNTNAENTEELPIKKVELRLKVVLKFDFKILDILGFKKLSNVGDGSLEEHLMILFPHGLQLLSLINFKLKKSSLIKIEQGKFICPCNGNIVVVGQHLDTLIPKMHIVDIADLSVKIIELESQPNLINCFPIDDNILLVFKNKVLFFNLESHHIEHEWKVPVPIKFCQKLKNDLITIVSEINTIHLFSRFGNPLFSTEHDEDDPQSFPLFDYSDFIYLDASILSVCKNGEYQLWNFWELSTALSFSNFRTPRTHIIQNNVNNIMLYSPANDTPLNNDFFPTITLPTKTLNNCISKICINEQSKLMAVFISNKDILLIQNLETSLWYRFTDISIIDMQWLGSSYLICHTRSEDDTYELLCARIPLQETEVKEFNDYVTWKYEVPESVTILSMFVNTLYRYNLLKVKHKDDENGHDIKKMEQFFKTGEVVITTTTGFVIFDVISSVAVSGINIIRKFHKYDQISIVDQSFLTAVRWVTSFKDSYLVFYRDKLLKMKKTGTDDTDIWETIDVLSGIERIVDVLKDEIYFIQKNHLVAYKISDLWEGKSEILTIPIEEEMYPISVSPESAITHSLQCVFNKDFSRLVIKHEIYLDKLILAKLKDETIDLEDITYKYYPLRHYKFALEKILSNKVLNNEDITQIIELVKLCHNPSEPSMKNPYSDMLEIVSNCLRKIETKYWNYLFTSLKMTPRDLLALCIECNEAKALGVLLLVFLNYDETEFVNDLKLEDEGLSMGRIEEDDEELKTPTSPEVAVPDILKDQELMLRILQILVTSAASTTNRRKASESWDMCFQLTRLLKELDKQNNTHLIDRAIDMF